MLSVLVSVFVKLHFAVFVWYGIVLRRQMMQWRGTDSSQSQWTKRKIRRRCFLCFVIFVCCCTSLAHQHWSIYLLLFFLDVLWLCCIYICVCIVFIYNTIFSPLHCFLKCTTDVMFYSVVSLFLCFVYSTAKLIILNHLPWKEPAENSNHINTQI